MSLLGAIRKAARRTIHLDVQRATPITIPLLRLVQTLKQRDLDTVIDVGANYGGSLRKPFRGRIYRSNHIIRATPRCMGTPQPKGREIRIAMDYCTTRRPK